jgi:cytoskeleton protein RodZ
MPAMPATPQPPPVASGAPPRQSGFRLVARTIEPTWIRVRMDDGRVVEETIPAGQVREWVSPGPFTLTVGNAGGIALELNGRALPPLGASGVVIPRLVVPAETP